MTSERASRANRRNAQVSTGPRTLAGKARSRQNARKHGLSAMDPNPDAEIEIERLADLIANRHGRDANVGEAARAIAEAQVQLQRVFACRIALLRNRPLNPEGDARGDEGSPARTSEELLLQLERLERYERRALSRRKFAIRRFYELVGRATQVVTEPGADE
ncbi:conserved hypothetical protein [Methylobacterium radiotolerans JCM 2831]|uniref:Uncharacterized protein n=1 Tax=Methylobacterium radiotolerans (strain ATCC 27329 / DSM 1819 / JCM 2831 / NBRC 15690 / NCIMB 10815 / 0-1) TaxID=426355 RepID=B1M2U4_METRJ|nr:conserved hypothetical protein [Methylobacterium radiotolerans JCM 2831]GEN00755.1 hypothetical protein MRA01_52940 [Methylobacterium radiotolerans]